MITKRERLAIAVQTAAAAVVLIAAPLVAERLGLACAGELSLEQWYCLARHEQGPFVIFALLLIVAAATYIYVLDMLNGEIVDHSCGKDRRELVWLLAILGALAVLMAYALHVYFTPCSLPEPIRCETRRVASLAALALTALLLANACVVAWYVIFIEGKHSCEEEKGGTGQR